MDAQAYPPRPRRAQSTNVPARRNANQTGQVLGGIDVVLEHEGEACGGLPEVFEHALGGAQVILITQAGAKSVGADPRREAYGIAW